MVLNVIKKYKKYKKENKNTKKIKHYKKMVGGYKSLNKKYLIELSNIIKEVNETREDNKKIDESHGLHHGLIVCCNVSKALEYNSNINDRQKLLIKLAALLHDIDDHKYFPDNHKFENARKILHKSDIRNIDNLTDNEIATILLMIYLVSSSTHGDTMPCDVPEWYFYPRYADRLEAVGIIGLERTYEYTLKKGQPLYINDTKRSQNIDDLYNNIATVERYKQYSMPGSASKSMVDHMYDKLLRLGDFPIKNEYFKKECASRIKPLSDFCLKFSEKYPKGELLKFDKDFDIFFKDFIKKYDTHVYTDCSHQTKEYISYL
jgi:uncharacterized protein